MEKTFTQKRNTFLFIFLFSIMLLQAQEWTWVKGPNGGNQYGNYGTQGVASVTNLPGSRAYGGCFKDNAGNFWIFGGGGYGQSNVSVGGMNDLWKYDITTNQWTWVKGATNPDSPGIYGTIGVAAVTNNPGGRQLFTCWTDNNGNFWVYGGYGADISSGGFLNDLWKYDVSSNQWTWVHGSSTAGQAPIYGTQGVAASANTPGGRTNCVSWTDNNGDLWLFGGGNLMSNYNDLWKYNIANNQWTWVSGTNLPNQPGIYGTQGVASSTNNPGARIYAVNWVDNNGNLWLFGGAGYTSTGSGSLNDLWKYDIVNNTWTWVKGTNTINSPATYGTIGVSGAANTPGARNQAASWKDSNGNLWLFSGEGYAAAALGKLNDLWRFDIVSNEWTWIKGSNLINQLGTYGTIGVQASTNNPGSKLKSNYWVDNSGNFWIFGGYGSHASNTGYMNDLWKFVICTALPPTPANITPATNQNICTGNTTTLSVSGGAYSVNWFSSLSSTNSIASGVSYITSPLSTGTYTFYAEASNNCGLSINKTAISVTVSPNPTISINNGSICMGQVFTLTPSGASNYIFSSGSNTVSPTSSTNYSITGISSLGCPATNTAIASITVNALPIISVNSGSICAGSSFIILPTGASTYTVSGGTFTVFPTSNSNYSVTGTSAEGCVSYISAISTVTVNALPTLTVTSSPTLICVGESALLNVSGALSYTWNTNETENNVTINPNSTTTYTVSGTDNKGCENFTTITQSVTACLGIQNLKYKSISTEIYPNPNSGKFTIVPKHACSLKIMNSLGDEIFHSNVEAGKQEINLPHIHRGIYFAELSNNLGTEIVKFTVWEYE